MSLVADPDGLPEWLRPLAHEVADVDLDALSAGTGLFRPPAQGGRPAAVLVLFGDGPGGPDGPGEPGEPDGPGDPDVVLIERARGLRSHAGQVAFPGGAIDPDDDGPVAAALREAEEETAVDPIGVLPFATLPALYLPASGFLTTPVLGWWQRPGRVRAGDPGEVASAHRVPLAELADPANRFLVRHPIGDVGPGFRAGGLFVWGFTAALLDRLLTMAGWAQPWDRDRRVDLPEHLMGRRR